MTSGLVESGTKIDHRDPRVRGRPEGGHAYIATHPGPRKCCSSNKFNDPISSYHLFKDQSKTTMSPSTKYTIKYTTLSHDYRVSSNGVHCFHVDNSSMTIGKPDLTFHSSDDNMGPVVGTCKFRKTSSSSNICLGSPSSPIAECQLQREGSWHIQYWFSIKIDGNRRAFSWKRTSSNGSGYKLVEKGTKDIFARFLSKSIWSPSKGTMEISGAVGEDFEMMALMSGLTVIERSRRRSNSGGGAAGGGGGGGC